jgi:ATP-binding cassette, subfamily B, bacterial
MKGLQRKLQEVLRQRDYIVPTLKLVWAAAPKATTWWAVLLVLQGFLPGLTVYLTKLFIDSLVQAMKLGLNQESLMLLAWPTGLMAGVIAFTQISGAILSVLRMIQAEYVQDHIRQMVHTKSIAVDLAFHELSEFHDKLYQARDNAGARSLSLLESSGSLIQNLITLVTIVALLIPYGIWLPGALIVISLPAFYFVVKFNRKYHSWWERTTPLRRQADYHDFLITQSFTAAEVRLFDLGDYLQTLYQGYRKKLRQENIKLTIEQSTSQMSGAIVGIIVAGAVLAWMMHQALTGRFTLGDLALFYQAFTRGQAFAKSLLGQVSQIYNNTLFLSNLYEFLNLQPSVADPIAPTPAPENLQKGIQIRNVSFRYPGSDRWIFEDFNLDIPAGKVVAIVGENGAGKSTLIKLLCRFYDPETGSIMADGVDIRHLMVRSWRRMLTVMFQFPVTYQKTVAENLRIGDVANPASTEEIRQAIADAGATEIIDRLPKQEETQLGKWFAGGTDLSGGEWQRISLARAFLRKAPIMILDEPTSFMDSWSEHDWLDRFRRMAGGRTAVVITHRFTLAMRADLIYVMQAGKVVETGTHETLLAQNGQYAQSWRSQTQEYRVEDQTGDKTPTPSLSAVS